MKNLIKFLISLLLVLIIIYIYDIKENFSRGRCYDRETGEEKVINIDGKCVNVCVCLNGTANLPSYCALKSELKLL